MTSISKRAFAGCMSLERIEVSETNSAYISDGGILYNKDKTKIIIVPLSIKGDITISDGVTTIEESTFEYCTSLTGITIGGNVTSIGGRAFYNCSSLTNVNIPDSVTSIGWCAFEDCGSLTSVNIPDGVTSIGESAFRSCTSLKTINYKGSKEQWDSISKGTEWNYNTGSYTINYNYVEN